ncbi:MAG: hypothetical protein NW223_22420 [Hyphomicrobiaceae bacterium]|nr:hypothetical protein [Hyphomicrobiaceae bacterium]
MSELYSPDRPADRLDPLIRDLVSWVACEPRPYAEVMEAWRTSCPRLAVWEDAVDRGYVTTRRGADGIVVHATELGRTWLRSGQR